MIKLTDKDFEALEQRIEAGEFLPKDELPEVPADASDETKTIIGLYSERIKTLRAENETLRAEAKTDSALFYENGTKTGCINQQREEIDKLRLRVGDLESMLTDETQERENWQEQSEKLMKELNDAKEKKSQAINPAEAEKLTITIICKLIDSAEKLCDADNVVVIRKFLLAFAKPYWDKLSPETTMKIMMLDSNVEQRQKAEENEKKRPVGTVNIGQMNLGNGVQSGEAVSEAIAVMKIIESKEQTKIEK